jgi:hypothetical protein
MDDRFSAAEQRKTACERPPRSLRSRILPLCEGESRRRRQGVTRTPSRIPYEPRSGDRIFRRRFPSAAFSSGYILPPLRGYAFQG